MGKIALLLISCIAITLAAPQGKSDEPIAIVKQESNIEADGSYKYGYETANGIKGDETGTLKKTSDPQGTDVIVVQGSFSYTSPDGKVITVTYIADDDQGFVPQGEHLPTPPPIPPAIQKSLEYIASLPPAKA